MLSGTLTSLYLLLSHPTVALASHITIILTFTLQLPIELQAAAPPSAGSAVPVHPAVSSHLESLGQDSYGQNQAQIYAPRVLDPALQAQRDQREREEREEEERKKREVHWSKLEPLQTQQEKRGLANDVDGLHQHNPAGKSKYKIEGYITLHCWCLIPCGVLQ